MAKKLVRVLIEDLIVFSNGDVPGESPASDQELKNNAVVGSLLYPRSGAPEALSVIQLDLKNNQSPETLNPSDFFSDSGLFKEEVQDETILKIKVTNRDSRSRFAQIFGRVLGGLLGIATGGFGSILGLVSGLGIDALTDSIETEGGEQTFVIGASEPLRLKIDQLPQNPPLRVNLPLVVPKEIRKRFFVLENGKAVQHELVLGKGKHNGHIILQISAEPA